MTLLAPSYYCTSIASFLVSSFEELQKAFFKIYFQSNNNKLLTALFWWGGVVILIYASFQICAFSYERALIWKIM